MRLLSPDHACVGVETDRRRYRGTVLEVNDPADIRDLRTAGYTVGDVSGIPSKAAGFECRSCNFASYFKKCSRCGSVCDRPDLVA